MKVQKEEFDRLNQLVVDMQDWHDTEILSQPQIPCMRPLEVRLMNEDIVDNETSDNQNNRVELVEGQVCSASEEATTGKSATTFNKERGGEP